MKEMAEFLCGGSWTSSLDGEDDGRFELHVESNGQITGDHFLPPDGTEILPVRGTCIHSPNHHIEIRETRNGRNFRYHARIIPDPTGGDEHKLQDGRRSRMANDEREKDKKDNQDDEVWTGTHST
jgi:hypothetical protein